MQALTDSQLVWRCRRGVRELDVLFSRFLADRYGKLDKAEQLDFQCLLEVQDPTIMDWLFGKEQPESKFLGIIKTLQTLAGIEKKAF